MGITKIRGLLAIAMAGLLLAGCASNEPEETKPAIDTTTKDVSDGEMDTTPVVKEIPPVIRPNGGIIINSGAATEEILDGVFYFDFDQAIVKRMGHEELDRHANILKENRGYRVRLEGHADERGTREYNLALGERRANAVRAYLVAQGVSRTQMEVVSLGEEKPAVTGTGESSWAKNRRVEFKYRN